MRFAEGRNLPTHEHSVALLPCIDAVVEFTVEVRVIAEDSHAELDDVEPRVASHERVEGPRHRGEPVVLGPSPLVQLDRLTDAVPGSVGNDARGM
ncbi:MAG: hypothetical protein EBY96_06685 [Actinobacteria bacterium]|nr:hypothetical protein [Actinomycetota bacterium]